MSPEQQKIQELEKKVEELTRFMLSWSNPSQVSPQAVKTIRTIIGNNLTLNDLSDVSTAGVTNGQVIKYNDSNQTWEPGNDNVA